MKILVRERFGFIIERNKWKGVNCNATLESEMCQEGGVPR